MNNSFVSDVAVNYHKNHADSDEIFAGGLR